MKFEIFYVIIAFTIALGQDVTIGTNHTSCGPFDDHCNDNNKTAANNRTDNLCVGSFCASDIDCCEYTTCNITSQECVCKYGPSPHNGENTICYTDNVTIGTNHTSCGPFDNHCNDNNKTATNNRTYNLCVGSPCASDIDCCEYTTCNVTSQECVCKYVPSPHNGETTICYTDKQCSVVNNCTHILESVCDGNQCLCSNSSFPYPVFNDNKTLKYCSSYKQCSSNASCDDIEECNESTGTCVCKFGAAPEGSNHKCNENSCSVHTDCDSYEECSAETGSCECKYGTTIYDPINKCNMKKSCVTTQDCGSIPYSVCDSGGHCTCPYSGYRHPVYDDRKLLTKCSADNPCTSDNQCRVANSHCFQDKCACMDGFRTLTNSDGKIQECYQIDCYLSRTCGVFSSCVWNRCTCENGEDSSEGGNTTCQGDYCIGWSCGENEECIRNRCKCKYGLALLQNKTAVCKTKNYCSTNHDCGGNAYCNYYFQKCECSSGFTETSYQVGKFSCVREKVPSFSGNPTWIIATIVSSVAIIMFTGIGIVSCVRRRQLQRQRNGRSNSTPLPTLSSSVDETDSQAHSNRGFTPEVPPPYDHPPPYDDPPPYEAVVKMVVSEC